MENSNKQTQLFQTLHQLLVIHIPHMLLKISKEIR